MRTPITLASLMIIAVLPSISFASTPFCGFSTLCCMGLQAQQQTDCLYRVMSADPIQRNIAVFSAASDYANSYNHMNPVAYYYGYGSREQRLMQIEAMWQQYEKTHSPQSN